MKTQRTCRLLIGLLALTNAAQAQSWSGGIRFDITTGATKRGSEFTLVNVPYSSNEYSSSDADAPRLGGFVRYDRPKWLAQAELTTGGMNLNVRGGAPRIGTIDASAVGIRRALGLTGGYKPAPWLRLQVGFAVNRIAWQTTRTAEMLTSLQNRIGSGTPSEQEFTQASIDAYTGKLALENNLRRTQLTGHYGIGLDLGGFTIDVSRTEGLTPLLDGVTLNGQPVDARLNYSYTSLNLGYRLFPLRRFLAPKKTNRAYQRIRREIPFFRNEFHLGLGNQAEDINAGTIYEARYTRFLTRRFGLTGTLSLAKRDVGRYQGTLVPANSFIGSVMGRVLPLYTRRHQIALSVGPQLSVTGPQVLGRPDGTIDSQGRTTYAQLTSEPTRVTLGVQGQFDYQIAVTDRLPVGVWLRSGGYGGFYGIQFGYRF